MHLLFFAQSNSSQEFPSKQNKNFRNNLQSKRIFPWITQNSLPLFGSPHRHSFSLCLRSISARLLLCSILVWVLPISKNCLLNVLYLQHALIQLNHKHKLLKLLWLLETCFNSHRSVLAFIALNKEEFHLRFCICTVPAYVKFDKFPIRHLTITK